MPLQLLLNLFFLYNLKLRVQTDTITNIVLCQNISHVGLVRSRVNVPYYWQVFEKKLKIWAANVRLSKLIRVWSVMEPVWPSPTPPRLSTTVNLLRRTARQADARCSRRAFLPDDHARARYRRRTRLVVTTAVDNRGSNVRPSGCHTYPPVAARELDLVYGTRTLNTNSV